VSVSPDRSDFVGPIIPIQHSTLQGIAAGLPIGGTGTVRYTCQDNNENHIPILLKDVLFVPNCPSHLICPRQLLHALPGDATASITENSIVLHFGNNSFTVAYDTTSRLPILWTSSNIQAFLNFTHSTSSNSNTTSNLANLTPSQHIKMRWHNRLNHIGFDQLTSWMKDSTISVPPEVANCPSPMCSACLFGKAKCRPHAQHKGSITSAHTTPGDGVSADQFEAGAPGIVPTTKGLPTSMTYKYCNFRVDHFSKLIFVTMHPTKDSREMLRSKSDYESFCRLHGVHIKSPRTDNGIYSSSAFRATCNAENQHLSFCGVGSHWQNGLAERTTGVIQAIARTILLNAMAHWPHIISEAFWPFAITHSIQLYNISIRQGHQKSPWELFTGTPPAKSPRDSRIFGCPAFVLHKTCQDNPEAAKTWASRSWQGVYVGFSPFHASTVAHIYNPSTRHVTPQFHVVFVEDFSTVSIQDPNTLESRLEHLFTGTSNWEFKDAHGNQAPYFFDEPAPPHPPVHSAYTAHCRPVLRRPLYKPVPCSSAFRHWKQQNHIAAEVYQCSTQSRSAPNTNPPTDPTPVPTTTPSGIASATPPYSSDPNISTPQDLFAGIATISEGVFSPTPYLAFPALDIDNDSLTQSNMLRAPDTADFIAAQIPEIQGLHQQGVFSYHPIAELPPGARLLNAIWSYRRKHSPTGALLKHKSCLCTDGSQQRPGIDFTATYAPVVQWSTVCLVLALANMKKLSSCQVDFAQAFMQSPIDMDVFMKIPQGWFVANDSLHQHSDPSYRDQSHFIRLVKTLYGTKQAARQWFKHLQQGLLGMGFNPPPSTRVYSSGIIA